MATYTQMVEMVRSWANRDAEVLRSADIKTFINFAADNVYRNLRIAPLENVSTYTINIDDNDTETYCSIVIPVDATEFIQLRKKDANSLTGYTVYANKADIRSFYEESTSKYDYYNYTREQNEIIVHPNLADGDVLELYYYRRLPEMDARYVVDSDVTNWMNYVTPLDSIPQADRDADPDLVGTAVTINSTQYVGNLVPHWLRDQNEKLVLYGALGEAFMYLNEPEQAAVYMAQFNQEIARLNNEEHKRKYMGGAIQAHYQSRLI